MLAEFVLIISMTAPLENWEYKGHFMNCNQAIIWQQMHYPKAKATRCLLQKYIALPKATKKRTYDVRDGKNGKRLK